MTRTEEAKKWLREELERLRRAPDLNGCPMTQEWAEQIRVFTVALEAIEAQESNRVESDTVKGVEIDQFKNEPLTLDELREAAQTGDPVWLVRSNCSSWVVIEKVDDRKYIQLVDYAEFGSDEPYDFAISDYGDAFIAYHHKPEEGTI